MGIKVSGERPWAINLAECKLRQILSEPLLKDDHAEATLAIKVLRQQGLTKGEIKAARRNIGVISEAVNGIQYWRLPKEQE